MRQNYSPNLPLHKPVRVVLMHGKDASPTSKKWYIWLSNLLDQKGIELIAPELPKTNDPVLEEWILELEKTNPDQNTILIGHSMGGATILRWLEALKAKQRVAKIILVAVNVGDTHDDQTYTFYIKGVYNYEKIKQHCDDFVVIHSQDDEWVPFESGVKNAKGLGAKFYQLDDRGHFGRKVNDLPELEEELFS